MGAFVWEWADHAIKTRKGFLYGGDFGETECDGNFCCDGIVTPDRKLKSSALEMKAVYGGKLKSEITEVEIPKIESKAKQLEIAVDPYTGCLNSIKADGEEILKTPMCWNIIRFTDNDRRHLSSWRNWEDRYRFPACRPEIYSCERRENGYVVEGVMAPNTRVPAVAFSVIYTVSGGMLTIEIEYKIADHVPELPRFGFEFGVAKKYDQFAFVGFGKGESYVDKHVACEYGYYESDAKNNYDYKYIRPQESGSHYASKYLCIKDLFTLTAEAPFSFSVNPYTTKQLYETTHHFKLPENDFINVCVDLAMRGIGSHSCGPVLAKEFEIPKTGKNIFKFQF
jgi:beta-galactosidase